MSGLEEFPPYLFLDEREGVCAGVCLRIRLQPNARTDGLRELCEDFVRWSVQARPIDEAANKALCVSLAEFFGIPPRKVTLRSGGKSRLKLVFIEDCSIERINALLLAAAQRS